MLHTFLVAMTFRQLRPILFNECLTTKLFCILTDGRFLLKFLSSLIIKLSQERSCISVNSRNLSESFRGSLRKKVFSSKSEIFREERLFLLTREEEKIGLVNFLNQPKQWQQKHSRDNMSFTFLPQKLLKVSNVRLKP